MIRTVAIVLIGLFRSWEFLFISGAVVVLLPFVFSIASRRPRREGPATVQRRRRPPTAERRADETSEAEPVG